MQFAAQAILFARCSSEPAHAGNVACRFASCDGYKGVQNKTRCAGDPAQARYCQSAAVHWAAGSYSPLGGDRPAPTRVDALDPAAKKQKLNNLQLKAGGLVLRTESPDTGPRPVVMTPCESCRADLARSDAPNILAPSRRSFDQRWHRSSLGPRSVAPSSAFSAWEIPRTAYSRCVP